MSASTVKALLDAAFLLAMAAWTGGLAFGRFGASPLVGRTLGPDEAARLRGTLWLRLWTFGATCGAIALPASLGAPLSFPEYRGPRVGIEAGLLVIGTLAMLYGVNGLAPAIEAARRAGTGGSGRWECLRRRGERLDALVIALGAGLLISFAFRPPPRTTGIIEPSPAERTRRALEAAQPGARKAPAPAPGGAGPG